MKVQDDHRAYLRARARAAELRASLAAETDAYRRRAAEVELEIVLDRARQLERALAMSQVRGGDGLPILAWRAVLVGDLGRSRAKARATLRAIGEARREPDPFQRRAREVEAEARYDDALAEERIVARLVARYNEAAFMDGFPLIRH